MRQVITHAIAVYVGAGLFGGLLMATAIPALNALGVAYITVTWPAQIYCARTDSNCGFPVAPTWAFTIEGPTK